MKKTRSATAILLAFILCVIGCAASGPPFESVPDPDGNSGVVTLYRLKAFTGGGGYPIVYIDGHEVGTLKNGGYGFYMLPPGEHSFVLSNTHPKWTSENQTWFADVEGDSQLFYKVVVGANDYAYVEQVSKKAALDELPGLKKSDPDIRTVYIQ